MNNQLNNLHPGESLSLWKNHFEVPTFAPLKTDLKVDVCVIGAGIGGLTTAYLLAKTGMKVAVLESFDIGSGQTGRTTAQLTTALDHRYFSIERQHGKEGALMAAQSHQQAINKIEEIVRLENIQCDMERVNGYLFTDEKQPVEILFKELDAIHRAGLTDVHILAQAPLSSFDTGLCLKFPRQLQIHPMKYLSGLADSIIRDQGMIFTHTPVVEVHGGNPARIKTKMGSLVTARAVVVATHTPFNDLFAIHTKQAAYRTYVIAVKIPQGSVTKGLYWDTLDPYHYLRVESKDAHSDLLIVGGEDHKTGQNQHPEDCYRRLESWTRDRFPFAQEIEYKWSGQIMEPNDGMAFLGHNPMDRDNVYVITGDSGNGMTHGTIGGMLIRDQILGNPNSWEALYNPSRITLGAFAEFLKENANVAAQYGDWFTGRDFETVDEIPENEGAVVRRGLEKIAVYRDQDGNLELYSAACPHLGGVVQWNAVEKSWDCPCHGSRFDCHGKVMEGPAFTDLKPVEQFSPMGPDAVEKIRPSTNLYMEPIT